MTGLARRRGSGYESARAAGVARLAHHLAGLSRAGLAARRSWEILADHTDPAVAEPAARVDQVLALGGTVADGLCLAAGPDPELRWLAAACAAADRGGASLADVLDPIAAAFQAQLEAVAQRRVAMAGPRATALVLTWLPLAGLVLGPLLGVDLATALLGTPAGWSCLLAGLGLWLAGRWWLRHLIARAAGSDLAPGAAPPEVVTALVAALVTGGLPPDGARELALGCLAEAGVGAELPESAAAALRLAQQAGLAPSGLLREAAAAESRDRAGASAVAAARLSVLVVLPTGLCLLPAFVLLTVAPLVIALLTTGLGSF